MDLALSARNAELGDLVDLLKKQHDLKYDVVVPSTHLYFQGGNAVIEGGGVAFTEEGVDAVDAVLVPTQNFDRDAAERLGIPYPYVRKMREAGELDLLDRNLNRWTERTERNHFIRGFRTSDHQETGIARSWLSDRFQTLDHIDSLFSALDGVRQAGVEIEIRRADLSETKLRVCLSSPQVLAQAPNFMRGYRAPNGQSGADNPYLAAGVMISNSETGGGAFTLAPWVEFLVCTNGQTRMQEAIRKVHIGAQMETGVVSWSAETRQANIELIRSQSKDAMTAFLSADYLQTVVADLEGLGPRQLDRPQEVIESIGKKLAYTEDERASILDFFIKGGQPTAGGLMNAVTAYAQTVDDPDRAAEFEDSAFEVLAKAAALAA
jgi:hypothetical protein